MTTLQNYPNYSQLSAKINGPNDCVPTSIKDAVKYLVGVELDLDAMVAAIYGPNYHGFTSARAFVPYIAQHGVKLFPIDGDNATLVQVLHEQIKLLHPCLLTEPDPYAPLHPDWSHVLSVYGENTGTLTARDPYSTHDVTHADAEWQSLLEFREIWALERIEETVKIDITTPGVDHYFEALNDHQWKCKQTGHILGYGMLDFYKGFGNAALCGLTFLGLNKTDEIPIEKLSPAYAHLAGKGITVMFFERGATIYDPAHLIDNPPGSGSVYLLQLYNDGPGQDPFMLAKITDLTAANAMQAQKITDLQQGQANPQLLPDMQHIKDISGKY